jgi:hypothetical protein
MELESLTKDDSIINIIKRLKLLGFKFRLFDYWEIDLCAIGVKQDNKLIYISTCSFLHQKVLKYDYDFELNSHKDVNTIDENNKPKIVGQGRGVLEDVLLNKISEFWKLSPTNSTQK